MSQAAAINQNGLYRPLHVFCAMSIVTITLLSLLSTPSMIRDLGRWELSDQNKNASTFVKEVASIISNTQNYNHSTNYTSKSDPLATPLHAWCPSSSASKYCQNSIVCEPCKRRFLILISSGRAASTTLTWMLDSLPGIRMSGENNDLISNLHSSVQATLSHGSFQAGEDKQGPWGHNQILPGSLACGAQSIVHALNPPAPPSPSSSAVTLTLEQQQYEEESMILGFKTIRFHTKNYEQTDDKWLENKVQYLKETFPCAKFIVNTRASNVQGQIKSVRKAFEDKRERKFIRDKVIEDNRRLRKIYKLLLKERNNNNEEEEEEETINHDRVLFLDSNKWLQNITMFNEQVIDWLGYSRECYFEEFFEFNTQEYKGGIQSLSNPHSSKCRYLHQ